MKIEGRGKLFQKICRIEFSIFANFSILVFDAKVHTCIYILVYRAYTCCRKIRHSTRKNAKNFLKIEGRGKLFQKICRIEFSIFANFCLEKIEGEGVSFFKLHGRPIIIPPYVLSQIYIALGVPCIAISK